MNIDELREELKQKWEPLFSRLWASLQHATRGIPREILGSYLFAQGLKLALRAGMDEKLLREVFEEAIKKAGSAPAEAAPTTSR